MIRGLSYLVQHFKKLTFIVIIFFIAGCNANESIIDPINTEFETMSFDVVQKNLVIEKELPNFVQNLIFVWFNEKVKIDGFEGEMHFIVSDFNQDITSLSDGKKVDISLSFKVLIDKSSISQKKLIEGNISSFGTLTGNFSLDEFDTVIQNTQIDLINRLSKDLKSKI